MRPHPSPPAQGAERGSGRSPTERRPLNPSSGLPQAATITSPVLYQGVRSPLFLRRKGAIHPVKAQIRNCCCCQGASVVSDSVQPHQPPPSLKFSRQEHWSGLPFASPMHESESEVTESCPTFSDPMDCSPPGSSVHGIFQARVLEWGQNLQCILKLKEKEAKTKKEKITKKKLKKQKEKGASCAEEQWTQALPQPALPEARETRPWPGLPTPGGNQSRGDSGSHSAENRRQVQGTLLPAGLRHWDGSQWPPGPPRFTRLSLSQ